MQLKKFLPKSLFGRMLIIILVPMFLVQCITVFIFYERHWDSVTRQMAFTLSGEIDFITNLAGEDFNRGNLKELQSKAKKYFDFNILYFEGKELKSSYKNKKAKNYTEKALNEALKSKINYLWLSNIERDKEYIFIDIQLPNGILRVFANRKKIFSTTSWTFLGWTMGSSIILFLIALLFLKGQVRPIRQLAFAARQLGLGRPTVDWQLSGAKEVRLAGRAFQAMKHRINRQLTERTSMLAGVSHDLKTPLTRMRLQLALMKKSKAREALDKDILELENMINAYLSFAKGEAKEKSNIIQIEDILKEIIKKYKNFSSKKIKFLSPGKNIPKITLRSQAIQRVFENIIKNALDYSNVLEIRTKFRNDHIFIFFDDDGPGIEPEQRPEVIKPFVRLESSRNRSTGGTGLGLAIANDIILSHGGELLLEKSPLGGLRIQIKIPI